MFIRDNMLDILETITDGIHHSANNTEHGFEMLADCRGALKSIDDALVHHLSQTRCSFYHELITEIDNNMERLLSFEMSNREQNKIFDKLNKLMKSLYKRIKNESEVKVEVVFFPYKASMWDSLESIWMAAKDDPRCNVTVVPIPYYSKKPSGEFDQMYYEGGSFPDYVPVVHYTEYDYTQISPEIAYIHNPYDAYNHMSSVDPRWYSVTLRSHVRALVYVPYYVNMNPSNTSMSLAAACGGADIIIAQNESDAKSYTNHDAGKLVAALGSPKIDRVLRMNADKPEIPSEWTPLLEGKKTFLLITTVNTIFHYNESGKKLRQVLDYFEGRNDIALIWRPHPLELAALSSMRQEQLSGYTELLHRAEESKYCILDQTPDVETAIAIADAYIGSDGSSVCYMFKVTGKPVYCVDFDSIEEITDEDCNEALRSEYLAGPVSDGNYLWGACANYNGLARIDKRDGGMEYMGEILGRHLTGPLLFSKALKMGERILLTPRRANVFAEYNILTGEFKTVPIAKAAQVGDCEMAFLTAVKYEDYIYHIPFHSRAFARYNAITETYEYFYDWHKSFEKYVTENNREFFSGAIAVDDRLFLTSIQNNVIAEMNMKTLEFKVYRVGKDYYRYRGIAQDGECLWLTSFINPEQADYTDGVVRWNYVNGKIEEYNGFPENFMMDMNCHTHFGSIINCGDYLLALPFFGNMLVRIDKTTGEMTEFDTGLGIDFREREKSVFKKGSFAMALLQDEDTLFLTSMYDYSLLTINLKNGKTEKHKQRFKDEANTKAAKSLERFMIDYIYYENVLFPPERFITEYLNGNIPAQNVEQAEYYRSFVENTDGSCGSKIHEYVLSAFLSSIQ